MQLVHVLIHRQYRHPRGYMKLLLVLMLPLKPVSYTHLNLSSGIINSPAPTMIVPIFSNSNALHFLAEENETLLNVLYLLLSLIHISILLLVFLVPLLQIQIEEMNLLIDLIHDEYHFNFQ